MEECKEEILNLRAKNFDLKRGIDQTTRSAEAFRKQRMKIEELKKDIRDLRNQNEELSKTVEYSQRALRIYKDRDEAEQIGKQIFVKQYPDNSDAIENYNNAKQELLDLGIERMKAEGRTVILSYLDDLDHNGINDRFETIDHGKMVNGEWQDSNGADDRTERDFK